MKFTYCALDRDKKPVSGEMQAAEESEARQILETLDLEVTELDASPPEKHVRGGSISPDEVALFCDQLIRLTRTEMPLPDALRAMAKDAQSAAFRESLVRVAQGVDAGHALENMLAQESHVFPDLLPTLVLAGKKTGNLPETLRLAAQHTWRLHHLRQQVRDTLLYPAMIFVLMLVMGISIFENLGPSLEESMCDMGIPITPTNALFFWLTRHFSHLSILLGGGLLAVTAVWRGTDAIACLRNIKRWVLFHIPLYGNFLRTCYLARFHAALGLYLNAGISLDSALELLDRLESRQIVCCSGTPMYETIRSGSSLAQALQAHPYLFPSLYRTMVDAGERAGRLPETLEEIADLCDRQADRQANMIQTVVPVIGMTVVGTMVFILAQVFLTPLISLIQVL